MGSISQDHEAEAASLAPTIETALKADVREALPAELVAQVLSSAPFVNVPGAFNVRDLSQPVTETANGEEEEAPLIRKGFVYRSGMLSFITDEGKDKIVSELGIRTIFDLRVASERVEMVSPVFDNLTDNGDDGVRVETRWMEPAREPLELNMDDFAGEDGGVGGLLKMYRDILVTHRPVYREILGHIRDYPDKPLLFHCAAGKDRTGVLAALILQLAGYPTPIIARDYAMTRFGVEPVRGIFLKAANSEKFVASPRGYLGLCSTRRETMVRFLEELEERYGDGGAKGYVMAELGFGEEDVQRIRKNMRGC